MNFSDSILHYIQKHYSPTSTRIVHILIMLSITISVTTYVLSNANISDIAQLNNFNILMVILELVIAVFAVVIVVLGRKNSEVEKIQKVIILNTQQIDEFDTVQRKETIEKIDAVLSPKQFLMLKEKRRRILKECISVLELKSE